MKTKINHPYTLNRFNIGQKSDLKLGRIAEFEILLLHLHDETFFQQQ